MYQYIRGILLYIPVITVICLGCMSAYPQQKAIDSLEKLLTKEDISTQNKILYMTSLGVYYNTIDERKAMAYALRAVSAARKQKDNKYGVYAYAGLAVNYADRDSIGQCYVAMDSCLWYIRRSTDAKAIAHGLNSLTIIKTMLGDRDDIPGMLQEGLERIKGQNEWILETKLYYSLFDYYLTTNLHFAKKYLNLASGASDKAGQPLLLMECKTGAGIYYLASFRKAPERKDFLDSALIASTSALELYHQKPDYISNYYYMNMLRNRSEIYMAREQQDSARHYANLLIKAANDFDIDYLSSGYSILCDIELTTNNLPAAKKYMLQAISSMDENLPLQEQYELHLKIAGIYRKERDFERTLFHTEEAMSVFRKDNDEKYIREGLIAEAKYNIKEKEFELEKARKKNLVYLFCFILSVSIGLFLLVLFWNSRLKLKNSRQEALILDKEKKDAELQTQLQAERVKSLKVEKENMELLLESEKNKVLRSISEVNHLRKELLVGNTQLQFKNETLDSIKQKLGGEIPDTDREIKQLLDDEKRMDEHFEEFTELLKKVHPNFHNELQSRAQQKLTALDLKYCTYTYLDLSSKDIASMLFVEPKTVRMTKYRLKQKLGLGRDDDLNLFIRNLINSEAITP